MPQLHELLAVEKTANAQMATLASEAPKKFKNNEFFVGSIKTLKMLESSPANTALELAARVDIPVRSTVPEHLDYIFSNFANFEDIKSSIHRTNQNAKADVMWRGEVFLPQVPVCELIQLEERIRRNWIPAMEAAPTIDAARNWIMDTDSGKFLRKSSVPDDTTKTEKIMYPVVMAQATDKHPAQIKEATKDVVVGTFSTTHRTGCITAQQKADLLNTATEFLMEVKKAKTRANMTEIVDVKIGTKIKNLLIGDLLAAK
jgi:hypothetical protein